MLKMKSILKSAREIHISCQHIVMNWLLILSRNERYNHMQGKMMQTLAERSLPIPVGFLPCGLSDGAGIS